jgi:3-hydroxymyristoyl/3-hydroxydecanoyl-(acyl carrier protein) dehydratase
MIDSLLMMHQAYVDGTLACEAELMLVLVKNKEKK